MVRINNVRFAALALLVLVALFVGGCASYKAQKAFDEAEKLTAEEMFDAAVQKYAEAAKLEPSSKKYKLELIQSRTKAAVGHVLTARKLTSMGKYQEALNEYRQAREFDTSIEVASQEEQQLRDLVEAQTFAEEAADFYAKRNILLARKALDRAFKLDPNNAKAKSIKDLIDRDQNTITVDGIELDVASDEPITLSFKDANIKEVFGILSKLSGINFIFDEEIRSQSISVLLEKATFAQALELIMQMNGLGKKVLNSKTIIIYPQSREKEKQYEDYLIQTFYLSHIDAKKAVNLLRTMLQLRKVYVHEERNALVIRDKPEVIRLAEQILNAADRENSEVLFDLELVAVSAGDDLNIGPKASAYSVSAGFSKDGTNIVSDALGDTTDGLVKSLNNLDTYFTLPSATFDFAKTLSDSEILASPKVRVRNKEKAKVHIGTREPVITVTQNGDNYSDSVQYVDVGVKVDVEPTIQLDNTVETKLKLEVSQVIGEGSTERGTRYLTISTTNAETVLTLEDGVQTIIGGLFEKQDSSNRKTFPILGDIPILGSLFTNFEDKDHKRQILLSITPHIIKNVEVPDVDVATIWSGGEDNLKVGPNFGAFAQPLVSEVVATQPQAAPAVKPLTLTETESAVKSGPETQPVTMTVPGQPLAGQTMPAEPAQMGNSAENPAAVKAPVTGSAQPFVPPTKPVKPAATAPETVPTEVLKPNEELSQPVVLEMPAHGPAVINFEAPKYVGQGEEFSVAVRVDGIENLYSAPLFVKYDPAVLELVDISEGGFLKQDGQTTVFSSSPNRATGQVIVGYKQGTGGTGASGSGTLFNLNFRSIATGEARIEVNRVNFRNPEGVRLQVVPEAVTIKVH